MPLETTTGCRGKMKPIFTESGVFFSFDDAHGRASRGYSLLAVLEADGVAEKSNDGYFISDDDFVSLDSSELSILGAPMEFPYRLKVASRNTPSDDDFSCSLELISSSGVRIPYSGHRTGCVVDIESNRYLLNAAQLKFMKALDVLEDTSREMYLKKSDRRVRVLDKIGDIQEAAGDAGVQTDDFLQSFRVARPEKIRPGVKFNEDGSVDVFPEAAGIEMTPEETELYAARAIRGRNVRKAVSVDNGGVSLEVLHSETYREGLHEIRENRHIEADEVGDLLSNPSSYFSNPDLFDLDGFGQRVLGLAEIAIEAQQRRGGSLMNINWDLMQILPDATIGKIDPENLRIETVDDLDSLEMAFDRARCMGCNTLVFKGCIFKCDPEALEEFIKVKKDLFIAQGLLAGNAEEALQRLRANSKLPEKCYLGLAIHDNVEELHVETFDTEEVDYRIPESLKASLFGFQKEGLLWLQQRAASSERSGLLADDMGLGKTLQLLSYVAGEMESGDEGPFLVIVPTTLLRNWQDEFERHFEESVSRKCLVLHRDFVRAFGDKGVSITQPDGSIKHFPHKRRISKQGLDLIRKAGLVVTNYELIRDYQISLGEIRFTAIICDEIQKAKNPSAQLTKAIKAMHSEVRIASTATPVENSLQDLWCIVDFMAPGYLGTLRDFRQRFVPSTGVAVPAEDIDYLRGKLDSRNLLLRRTKDDMLDLPRKTHHTYRVPMGYMQKELYSKAAQVKRVDWTQILGVLQNMIKICSHPYLAKPDFLGSADTDSMIKDCPKLGWTLNKLREIREMREKVIIFTQYRKMHQILLECIECGLDIKPPVISGETPINTRQKTVDDFNDSTGFNIMLLSPLAAGVGLTITGANHVIHYSRLWNPAKEDQATDRVYRIGQEKDVSVYYPVVEAVEFGRTIEEHIEELLSKKRHVASSFLVPSSDDSEIQKAVANMIFPGEGADA